MVDVMPDRIPVMTRAEVQSRIAGLLTVCAASAEGLLAEDDAMKQVAPLVRDVVTLYFGFAGENPEREEIQRETVLAVAAVYSHRLEAVMAAFTQAFTELAQAHGQVTGDSQAVSDIVRRLALHWAAQDPPQAETSPVD